MAKLHELIAVEKDLLTASKQMSDDARDTFSKKPDHFRGNTNTVTFFDEARVGENISEEKAMVTTVDDKLDYAFKFVGKYYDAILRKEATNQVAKADLVVEGQTLGTGVPATFLLGMEPRLKELRTMLLAIPTLEPAIKWELDTGKGEGVYIAPATATIRTEKIVSPLVLYEATDKHPAQIKEISTDKPVARVEKHVTSGMWSTAKKALVIERIDVLIKACKKARQRANSVDVVEMNIARKMFAYILSGEEVSDDA